MYLSTAPYLSFAGAHLPRLKVPIPLHLLLGRRISFTIFRALSRHAAWTLREQVGAEFVHQAGAAGRGKPDDLLELVRVQRLRGQIARAGFTVNREQLHLTGTFRRLPGPIPAFLRESALTQDMVIGNMEYRPPLVPQTPMVIDRFRYEDREAIEALYRRVFGPDAAEASRLRWDWQYHLNPQNPGTDPLIWIAREGPSIIGQYTTMPVALSVKGQNVVGSWGMDVMVAPERQRQGLGELLFSTWDRHVGASLGLGLSPSSHRLFQKLRWPEVGPVPYLVKPLTRRALRRAEWPMVLNRLVSAVTLPYVKFVARQKPLSARCG